MRMVGDVLCAFAVCLWCATCLYMVIDALCVLMLCLMCMMCCVLRARPPTAPTTQVSDLIVSACKYIDKYTDSFEILIL